MNSKKNVVCIKWGTKYPAEFVNKLYGMVKRNLSYEFRLVCFTDDTRGIRPEVETQSLPEPDLQGWWHKLWLFSPEFPLRGPTLFLDLDVVLVNSIDPFFQLQGDFCIIHEWLLQHRKQGSYNSSVMRWEPGKYDHIWTRFKNNPSHITRRFAGDQNWISECVGDAAIWPEGYTYSWKWHCSPRNAKKAHLPEDAKILVFHGRPNPDEAIAGSFKNYPAAPWLADYWRE
jgi:hypothetical protein